MEKKLLKTFIDLYNYDSEIETWSLEKFKENPPRLYRLQIINALMNALEIHCSYINFKNGCFISDIQAERWDNFKESNKFLSKIKSKSNIATKKSSEISAIFCSLLHYRLLAQKIVTCNDNIYAASAEFNLFSKLMNNPNKLLIKDLKKIEKVLQFCINPKKIKCNKSKLIDIYNFPDVDLNEIDLEWM